MRPQKSIAILCAAAIVSHVTALSVYAQENEVRGDLENFCAVGQQIITNTNLVPENVVYDAFSDMTASKPFVDEEKLITRQYVEYDTLPKSGERYAKLISCKFKSAERLNTFRGDGAAGEELNCKAINQDTFDKVRRRIDVMDPPEIIFDDDEVTGRGQQWIAGWPYQAVTKDADGAIHVRAKSLPVPYNWWLPMPARFLGVHYCHLVAPDYAEALLTGAIDPEETSSN